MVDVQPRPITYNFCLSWWNKQNDPLACPLYIPGLPATPDPCQAWPHSTSCAVPSVWNASPQGYLPYFHKDVAQTSNATLSEIPSLTSPLPQSLLSLLCFVLLPGTSSPLGIIHVFMMSPLTTRETLGEQGLCNIPSYLSFVSTAARNTAYRSSSVC